MVYSQLSKNKILNLGLRNCKFWIRFKQITKMFYWNLHDELVNIHINSYNQSEIRRKQVPNTHRCWEVAIYQQIKKNTFWSPSSLSLIFTQYFFLINRWRRSSWISKSLHLYLLPRYHWFPHNCSSFRIQFVSSHPVVDSFLPQYQC